MFSPCVFLQFTACTHLWKCLHVTQYFHRVLESNCCVNFQAPVCEQAILIPRLTWLPCTVIERWYIHPCYNIFSLHQSHTHGRKTHSNTYTHTKAVGTCAIATVLFLSISMWFFFMCLSVFFLCLSESECFLQDSEVLYTKTTHFISWQWKPHISFFFDPIPVTFAQHIPFWLYPQIPAAFQNSNRWEWICTFTQGDWRNAQLRFGNLTVCLSQRDH